MKQRKKTGKKSSRAPRTNVDEALRKAEEALAAGRYEEAVRHLGSISPKSPHYGLACKRHGAALLRLGKPSEALPMFQVAHDANPEDTEVLIDAGDAARLIGSLNLAETVYKEARRLGADGFQIGFGEASILQERKQWVKAIEAWTELERSYPKDPDVKHNLGKAWHELGETDRAVSLMLGSYESSGDRHTLSMLALLAPHADRCSHEEVRRLRAELGERLKAAEGDPADVKFHGREGGRVNIGYVSSFFHHPNWMKPVWALLNNQNRDKFNVHLFADGPADEINSGGGYNRQKQDAIHDTRRLGNRDLAKLISNCGIDVLVDLNGYSDVRRLGLWAAKPSPVTIGWFNHYATSGMPAIDWLIGDDIVIHPEEETFYSERIKRLRQSYLTFQVGYATPEVEIRTDAEPFTFGCLGSAYKITPEVRSAWIVMLKETSGTHLLVRNRVLGDEINRNWFLEFFTKEGIDAGRVTLLGPAEHNEFLQTYGKIDLALDTFPYNGGTTTMEALWQGVPVICFKGDRWVSRTSATLLNSGGLHDFIGDDADGYLEIAKGWSAPRQREILRNLRKEMRERLKASPVCDGAALARDFERVVFEIIG